MIIYSFGTASDSGYRFIQIDVSDDWEFTRPNVTAKSVGMNGVLDYFSTSAYPRGPFTARKHMLLTGTSASSLEAAIDDLTVATISASESKLWGLDRDNTTVWTGQSVLIFTSQRNLETPIAFRLTLSFFAAQVNGTGGRGSAA